MTADDPHPLVTAYLDALGRSDLDAMLALFADGAIVHSPLYGELPATEFYPGLFADTSAATLTLLGTMRGASVDGAELLSFWFHFDWRLPDGTAAPFEVIDLAELDRDGRIRSIRIVYDTVDVRPAFEDATGRR
ncbi:MAG: nuclear transport factor 2 family protein [Schumannella sp.]|nr:nuclear transport factor 2 family protein [Microbacteriaceae bacterium]